MKPAILFAALLCASLAGLHGCASTQPAAAEAAPGVVVPTALNPARFGTDRRLLPVRVGIEQNELYVPKGDLVGEIKLPPLPPDQQALLAKLEAQKQPPFDVLAFYQAPRGPEQGIAPLGFAARIAEDDFTESAVTRAALPGAPTYATSLGEALTPGEYWVPNVPAEMYAPRPPSAVLIGAGEGLRIGEGFDRTAFGKHRRWDP